MDIWLRTRLTSAICTAGRLAPGRQQAPQAIPLTSDIKKLSGSTKRIKTGIKWDPILLFILAAYSLNTKSLCQLALPLRRVVSMYMFLFFWSVPLDYNTCWPGVQEGVQVVYIFQMILIQCVPSVSSYSYTSTEASIGYGKVWQLPCLGSKRKIN